jgi:phenylpyruvate tautomerase PptA (4-oxalocrotonate tautomerase family)
MPNVRIETRAGWVSDPQALIETVQAALVEAIEIPDRDRTLRLIEHPASHFSVPPACGERFTLVEISLFDGRSLEAKRALYQALVRRLGDLGVPPSDVKVTLVEIPRENWGVRGGQAASDIDLGFEVRV